MQCRRVQARLSAFLDGEIPPREARAVEAHLKACDRCREEREALERTIRMVRELGVEPAPDDLCDRVLAGLDDTPSEAKPVGRPVGRWRIWWSAAAAIVVGGAIALLWPAARVEKGPAWEARRPSAPVAGPESREESLRLGREAAEGSSYRRAPEPVLQAAPEGRGAGAVPSERGLAGRQVPSVVSANVEIAVVSDDPAAAFERTVKIANAEGWLPAEAMRRALDRSQQARRALGPVVLFLAEEEILRLQRDLSRAGLEQVVRTQQAPAREEAKKELPRQALSQRAARTPPATDQQARRRGEDADLQAAPQAPGGVQVPGNRALLPQVQSIAEQEAVLRQVQASAPSLVQVTLTFAGEPVQPAAAGAAQEPAGH